MGSDPAAETAATGRVARAASLVLSLAAAALLATASAASAGTPPGDGYGHEYPPKGTVTIVKETIPDGSMQRFVFHPSYGLSADDFELGDGEWIEFKVKPGSYTVEEAPVAGWRVDSIVCDDYDSTGSGSTATIELSAGEHVVCTFTNAEETPPPPPPVTPPSNTPPAGAVAPAPAGAVKGVQIQSAAVASARMGRPSACVSRQIRVSVAGSPIRRIAFSVNGRLVRTYVTPRRRGPFRVTLPAGPGRVSQVTARVVFSNGVASRTLRTTAVRCAQQQVAPQFTG